jgi:hypothetical protein
LLSNFALEYAIMKFLAGQAVYLKSKSSHCANCIKHKSAEHNTKQDGLKMKTGAEQLGVCADDVNLLGEDTKKNK